MDRLRLTQEISDTELAELVREIQIVHETFTVHPVTNQILQQASETFSTVVGTLDAIHLATALFRPRNRAGGFFADSRFPAGHGCEESWIPRLRNGSVGEQRTSNFYPLR